VRLRRRSCVGFPAEFREQLVSSCESGREIGADVRVVGQHVLGPERVQKSASLEGGTGCWGDPGEYGPGARVSDPCSYTLMKQVSWCRESIGLSLGSHWKVRLPLFLLVGHTRDVRQY
jgi:hypothetical protein